MQEDCVRGESLKATLKAAVKATTKEGDKEQPRGVGQTPVEETSATSVEEEKEEVEPPAIAELMTTVPPGSLRLVLVFLRGRFGDTAPPFVQGKV
jgi:hypothetical protein